MTGSGTFLDQDFTATPNSGWTKKKLVTTFGGSATAGTPIGTRTDGYLDPSNHPPVGVPSSKLMPDVHLLSLPNGAFENGAEGWGIGLVGAGQATIDASTSLTGANSFLLSAPNNGDSATITCSYVPCTEGVQYYVATRAKLKSGNAILYLQVVFFDGAKTYTGNQSLQGYVTGNTLNTSGFTQLGYSFIPPAGTRYYYINVIASATSANYTGTLWVDEVRVNRAPVVTEMAPYLSSIGAVVARGVPARFSDMGVSALDFFRGDGTLESSAAMDAFVAAVPDRGVAFFPSGIYNFPKALTFTDKAVLVEGVARESVTLAFSGPTDGIAFYITSDQSKRVGVRNMRILSAYQKTSGSDTNNNGTAINIRMPPTASAGANYVYRQAQIDNVQIGTQNDDPHNPGVAWNWGVAFTNVWYGYITNVDHFGLPTSSGFLIVDADATAGDGHYYGAVAPILTNIKAYYGTYGILVLGYLEGIEISCCDFVAFNYGFYVPPSAKKGGSAGTERALAIWIIQSHFNALNANFSFDTCSDVMLTQVNFGSLHVSNNKVNVIGLYLYDVLGFTVIGGSTAAGGTYSDGTSPQDAFLIADGSGLGTNPAGRPLGTRYGHVHGVRLQNYTSQAIFQPNSQGNRFHFNNIVAGQPLAISDAGANNTIVAVDASGAEYHRSTTIFQSELQPQKPVRLTGVTRSGLYSNFPAAIWGTSFNYVTNPEADQGAVVYSDGANWHYSGNGAIVTNS